MTTPVPPNAGKVPDADELANDLYYAALGLRDAMAQCRKVWDYVGPLGSAGLQGEPWNMDPALADNHFLQANRIWAFVQVYMGDLAQPDTFDLDEALAPVRGGK
jgi:hypothetical protein